MFVTFFLYPACFFEPTERAYRAVPGPDGTRGTPGEAARADGALSRLLAHAVRLEKPPLPGVAKALGKNGRPTWLRRLNSDRLL